MGASNSTRWLACGSIATYNDIYAIEDAPHSVCGNREALQILPLTNRAPSLILDLCKSNSPLHVSMISDLLNARDEDAFGFTPLIWCAWFGNSSNVKTLLSLGASQCIADNNGCTPLYYAAAIGCLRVLNILIDAAKLALDREERARLFNKKSNRPGGYAPIDRLAVYMTETFWNLSQAEKRTLAALSLT